MIGLHNLPAAGKSRKRIGRGGSRGGTSGRGHKGQKARTSGTVRIGFEGGQMPLYRRIPKHGFTNAPFKKIITIVDVANLQLIFEDGGHVTADALLAKGLIKKYKKNNAQHVIKILGNSGLTKKLIIDADACSKAAKEVIESAGGQVRLTKES